MRRAGDGLFIETFPEYATKRINTEVAKLNEEIGQLRAEVEIVRSIVKGDVAAIMGNREAV
jgi:hypothetical protein